MSLEILFDDMEKSVFNRKAMRFEKKEFVAMCNSRHCAPKNYFKNKPYMSERYETFKFVEKNVKPGALDCPDCGWVLKWKQKE